MKQFLSIILRNQFNLFYRFGYTFISKSQLVEFDGNINNEIKDIILEKFKTVTPFEYDVEYLILQLDKENINESDFIKFEIEDITAIYPLSQQAKTSIESKIDQRIRIEQPIFETILPSIQTEIKTKEVRINFLFKQYTIYLKFISLASTSLAPLIPTCFIFFSPPIFINY